MEDHDSTSRLICFKRPPERQPCMHSYAKVITPVYTPPLGIIIPVPQSRLGNLSGLLESSAQDSGELLDLDILANHGALGLVLLV